MGESQSLNNTTLNLLVKVSKSISAAIVSQNKFVLVEILLRINI
jgi:hypothetical protein